MLKSEAMPYGEQAATQYQRREIRCLARRLHGTDWRAVLLGTYFVEPSEYGEVMAEAVIDELCFQMFEAGVQ